MPETDQIAFLCHPYHRGGVTRWMADMAVESARQGKQVYFVTVDPLKEFLSSGGKETMISLLGQHPNIKLVTKKVSWEFEFGTELYRAHVYKQLLVKNVPQGIPVILSDAVWMTVSLLKGCYTFVGVIHSDDGGFYYDLARTYGNNVDIFACVSKRISKKVIEQCHVDARKVYTIPCGIELPAFEPVKNDSGVLQLIFVGRIGYPKRIYDLVKICSGLARDNARFHLTIIGKGEEKQLEEKFIAAGLKESVSFRGWLSKEEIYSELLRSDLLLLTSEFEGMPIALMEAFSTGCGVVSTRVSGVEDYEHHPLAVSCLWLNSVGDTGEAIKNITTAIQIPFETRAAAARKIAETEFDLSICYGRYMHAIRNVTVTETRAVQKLSLASHIHSLILSSLRYIKLRLTVI